MRFASAALVALVALTSIGAAPAAAPAAVAAVPLTIDWNLTPAQIATTCKAEIDRADARITALTRMRSARTFATVVAPLETISADLNDATVAQQFLVNVAADKAVRAASQQCNADQSAFFSAVAARPELYAAIAAAQASGTAADDAQRKLTDLWLVQSKRAGAGLPEAARIEFVKRSSELSDLQDRFMANLGNDASTIAITTAQATGLPPAFIATLTTTATGYTVPVNESTYSPFMQNEADESARKAMYVAYSNRAVANVGLLEEAIGIRDQLAKLFGYPNWAAYVLADKMAQTPQRVDAFLANIDRAILPKARAERDELAALKGGSAFASWDVPYYQNMLRKQKYAVDALAVAQYFPVEHTIRAVLDIYAKLLGVTFVPIGKPDIYNPEVVGFEVHDAAAGVLLGTFYLDLYPRPGKYGHFANFPMIPRRVLPDGSVRAPMCFIVGNWSRPAAGHPALLTHREVETFFHEFGHNMAYMLADEPYETLNSGFRADFIEAPSQMLENFVWDPGILKQISANVTDGSPLPDALIAKMVAARYVDYALTTTQQIAFATIDMRYHSAGAHVDTTAVWQQTVAAVTPFTVIGGVHPQAGFGHIMAGYDAGYYGYLWSKVYAQDMFTAFATGGLENPAVGARYRNDILAPGRTYEPDVAVAAFLGRPMNPTAFYTELGIAPATSLRDQR